MRPTGNGNVRTRSNGTLRRSDFHKDLFSGLSARSDSSETPQPGLDMSAIDKEASAPEVRDDAEPRLPVEDAMGRVAMGDDGVTSTLRPSTTSAPVRGE